MLITDRLAQDLGQLLERELARADGNTGRLAIALLLLIGWRRNLGRSAKLERFSAEDAEDNLDSLDEDEDAPESGAGLSALKQQAEAFQHGNPYLRGLLFQDFHADRGGEYQELHFPGIGRVSIHSEAIRYVDEVLLMRPVELARANGDKPTNAHLLLQRLCRLSAAPGEWAETEVCRRSDTPASLDATWFRNTALALRAQRRRQGDASSAAARNRREASGPYWLLAGPCAEETGEELDLRDVVEIVPKPLRAGFSADPEVTSLLNRLVGVLNTRYRLLRTCGLLPEKWLDRDEPGINRLKDLAQMRKRAVRSASWQQGQPEAAFEQAFDALVAERGGKPVAGFSRFRRM